LHLEHLDPAMLPQRLPGISGTAKIFSCADVTREPLPVLPTVHSDMAGIPTNYRGEVIPPTESDPDAVVPGLLAAGGAECAPVHRTESVGAHARDEFPERDDVLWLNHTVAWLDGDGKVTVGYRAVHLHTLSNEVQAFPPKARSY